MSKDGIEAIKKQIIELNDPEKPFLYKIENDHIIGSWNLMDAKWVGLLANINNAKRDYQIIFTLDESRKTYDFTETYKTSRARASIGGASARGSFFRGKMIQKEYVWIPGVGIKNKQETVKPIGSVGYNFDTSKIKEPIITILNNNGWKPKGFLTKIFSH